MFKTIFENLKEFHRKTWRKVGFSDFKVVDKNSCYVTIGTFHDSKVSKVKWEGNVQLFDSHVATIKAVIIQINVNRFVVKQILKNYFKPP